MTEAECKERRFASPVRFDCLSADGNTHMESDGVTVRKRTSGSTDSRGLPRIWRLLSPFGGEAGGGDERGKKEKKESDTEVQMGRSGFQQITGCLRERLCSSASRNKDMATHRERQDGREEGAFVVSGEFGEDTVQDSGELQTEEGDTITLHCSHPLHQI